jgi:hypothetical protein
MKNNLLGKIENHFLKLGREVSSKKSNVEHYTVNCNQGKPYPRDCYDSIESAMDVKIERGDGFNIGASFKGGGSVGSTSFSSDFGFIISDADVIKLALSD